VHRVTVQNNIVFGLRQAFAIVQKIRNESFCLKGNHGDIGKVGAFIHEVKALTKAGKISQADADMLISEANGLLISLRFVESMATTHGRGHSQTKNHA
jgi:hypothetical protein